MGLISATARVMATVGGSSPPEGDDYKSHGWLVWAYVHEDAERKHLANPAEGKPYVINGTAGRIWEGNLSDVRRFLFPQSRYVAPYGSSDEAVELAAMEWRSVHSYITKGTGNVLCLERRGKLQPSVWWVSDEWNAGSLSAVAWGAMQQHRHRKADNKADASETPAVRDSAKPKLPVPSEYRVKVTEIGSDATPQVERIPCRFSEALGCNVALYSRSGITQHEDSAHPRDPRLELIQCPLCGDYPSASNPNTPSRHGRNMHLSQAHGLTPKSAQRIALDNRQTADLYRAWRKATDRARAEEGGAALDAQPAEPVAAAPAEPTPVAAPPETQDAVAMILSIVGENTRLREQLAAEREQARADREALARITAALARD